MKNIKKANKNRLTPALKKILASKKDSKKDIVKYYKYD